MGEVSVAKLTDIADGDYRIFAFDNIEVGIFRTGSKVLAYENICPHAGGPLGQGALHGTTLVCPWHAWEFDCQVQVDDGLHPAQFPVKIVDDDILIDVP